MRFLMLLAFALGACTLHTSNAATVPGTLTIVGSDTLSTLVLRWIDAFRAQHPEALIQMQTPGSASAPIALLEGAADIGPMSRPMNDAEIKAFRDRYGYAPRVRSRARDRASKPRRLQDPGRGVERTAGAIVGRSAGHWSGPTGTDADV